MKPMIKTPQTTEMLKILETRQTSQPPETRQTSQPPETRQTSQTRQAPQPPETQQTSQAPETPQTRQISVILQKSKLIMAVALAVILSFTFLGCEKKSREVDEDFLKSFFTAYYQNQIEYDSKLMDVIASGEDWQSADGFLWLKDYVTDDCAKKLLLNRYYPLQEVIGKEFDQFELKDFTTNQQSCDGYDQWNVSCIVVFSQRGKEMERQKVTAVMDTDDTKTRINTVNMVRKEIE